MIDKYLNPRPKVSPNRRNLTDRFLRSVKPGPRRILFWDTKKQGLALSVEPTGHRAFKIVYQHTNRPRWYTLGSYPRIGLADARSAARKILARATLGEDPQTWAKPDRKDPHAAWDRRGGMF
jgi:hypothetical protein